MNKQLVFMSLALVGVMELSMSAPVYGQWYTTPRGVTGLGIGSAAYGAYAGYGGGGYAAQTPGGANATGMGNLVRSMGVYNELTAKAEIDYQIARNQYIDNQHKIHEERLFRKREYQAQVAEDREAARVSRERVQEFTAAHRPLPLTSDMLNPTTGRIVWPVALKVSDFDGLRADIESLFESKSKYGATSETTSQILTKSREMQDLLRAQVLTIALPDYTESRKFLERLIASAR